MKKIPRIIFTALVIFALNNDVSYSQNLSVGIIGGPSRTYFWGPGNTVIHPDIKFVAGLSVEYSFSDYFTVLARPSYHSKGNVFEVGLTDERGNRIGETRVRNRLDYLTCPILAQAELGKKIKFLANAGPYFSYLLSAKNNLELPGGSFSDYFKKVDFGATFGIGVEFPLSPQIHLSILLSNDIGLYNISDSRISQAIIKNYATSGLVGVSYTFD